MIAILKKLISFRTLSKNEPENRQAIAWIEKQLKPHLHTRTFRVNGFPSLVATSRKTKKPKIWLAAHNDVVPGSDALFRARASGGRLYGRGACDMKFAIACYIRLAEELGKNAGKHDFGIMITSDEEIGGENGTQALLQKDYHGGIALLPDGGTPHSIETGAKGVWQIEAAASGTSAHASRPWLGENAIGKLICFITELERVVAPGQHSRRDKVHYHNTVNVGLIEGGAQANQVPAAARARIDIRYVPDEPFRKLERRVETLAGKYGVKIKTVICGGASKADLNLPAVKRFVALYKKHAGVVMKPSFAHGSSDARFFHEKGIPVIVMHPLCGGHHTEHEWIDLDCLERFHQAVKEWVVGS